MFKKLLRTAFVVGTTPIGMIVFAAIGVVSTVLVSIRDVKMIWGGGE